MLFKRRERRRRRGIGLARMLLSLFMLSLLTIGTYSAYKSFSGIDPLKVSPKNTVNSFLASETAYNIINGLLSFSPKGFAKNITENTIDKSSTNKIYPSSTSTTSPTSKPTPKPQLAFVFAVVTDSHNDNADLRKALSQAKQAGAKFIIGTGDWSDVGTIQELTDAKKEFDFSGLPYYVIPGDHDLWDSRNRSLAPTTDFAQVFRQNYTSFDYNGDHFLLVDNSDNYNGVGNTQLQFLENDLINTQKNHPNLILAFVHEPLYHPSSDHEMGKTNPDLKNQANFLIDFFKKQNVSEVLAGDTHFYSSYTEPTHQLKMTAVGAITADRNLQSPRFVLVDVYADGSYNISDTEVNQ